MKSILKYFFVILFLVFFLQCKGKKPTQLMIVESSPIDTLTILIEQSVESMLSIYLKYPTSKEDLISFLSAGDQEAHKYYDKLIKYKQSIIFKEDPISGYLNVKLENKSFKIRIFNLCEGMYKGVPSRFMMHKIIPYKEDFYLFDSLQSNSIVKEYYRLKKEVKENLNYKFEPPVIWKYYKYTKEGFESECDDTSTVMSTKNLEFLKALDYKMKGLLRKYELDKLLMVIPLSRNDN